MIGKTLSHFRILAKIGEGTERRLGMWLVNGAAAVWEPSVLRACKLPSDSRLPLHDSAVS